jgi:hypothetical protein
MIITKLLMPVLGRAEVPIRAKMIRIALSAPPKKKRPNQKS